MNTLKEKIVKLFSNKVFVWSISIVGLVAVSSSVYLLVTRDSNSLKNVSTTSSEVEFEEEDLVSGEPYLLLTITDYPKQIDDFCQSVVITFEAENVGDTALKYSDLEDKYYFMITSDNPLGSYTDSTLINRVDTTEREPGYSGLVTYRRSISDFGEIAAGEKKTISYNCISYVAVDTHEYYWRNSFSDINNGTTDYYVQFGRLPREGQYYSMGISDSSPVSITTNIKDSDGVQKYCEYEVIEDTSIDLYQF